MAGANGARTVGSRLSRRHRRAHARKRRSRETRPTPASSTGPRALVAAFVADADERERIEQGAWRSLRQCLWRHAGRVDRLGDQAARRGQRRKPGSVPFICPRPDPGHSEGSADLLVREALPRSWRCSPIAHPFVEAIRDPVTNLLQQERPHRRDATGDCATCGRRRADATWVSTSTALKPESWSRAPRTERPARSVRADRHHRRHPARVPLPERGAQHAHPRTQSAEARIGAGAERR